TSMVSDAFGNVLVFSAGNGSVYVHTLGSASAWTGIGRGSGMFADPTGNVFVTMAGSRHRFEHAIGGGGSWNLLGTGAAPPPSAVAYSPARGPLFGPHGPSYLDVEQGGDADCWLLAGLAEVATRDPRAIRNMFTYDGTTVENRAAVRVYTVRFFG